MSCVRSSPKIVRDGVEPPPATYQIAMLPLQHRTVGKVGVEPTVSCSQGTRGTVPLHPDFSRHLSSDPCGIRTRPVQLETLKTSPEVQRAKQCRHARRSRWVGRRSNPRLLVFSQALCRLSYRPRFVVEVCPAASSASGQKKARCPCDTGLWQPVRPFSVKRHKRKGCGRVFCRGVLPRPTE